MKWCQYVFFFFFCSYCVADPVITPDTSPNYSFPSLKQPIAAWVFTGIVKNEKGENYHYYFELQKKHNALTAIASITEADSHQLLLFKQANTTLKTEAVSDTQWQVGPLFLAFNAITNTWHFGVQSENQKGFQFKVDMLGQTSMAQLKIKDLRPGVKFSLMQLGLLNGYLQTGKAHDDFFVTSNKSWFQQLWSTTDQDVDHKLVSVLCEFKNGHAFYAIHLKDKDALQGVLAGWQTEQGLQNPISQFVSLRSIDQNWLIDIDSPKMHFTIQDIIPKDQEKTTLVLGTSQNLPGFCSIQQNLVG